MGDFGEGHRGILYPVERLPAHRSVELCDYELNSLPSYDITDEWTVESYIHDSTQQTEEGKHDEFFGITDLNYKHFMVIFSNFKHTGDYHRPLPLPFSSTAAV